MLANSMLAMVVDVADFLGSPAAGRSGRRDWPEQHVLHGLKDEEEMAEKAVFDRDLEAAYTMVLYMYKRDPAVDVAARMVVLEGKLVTDPLRADYFLTTAHKAKGGQWQMVQMSNDFNFSLAPADAKGREQLQRLQRSNCTPPTATSPGSAVREAAALALPQHEVDEACAVYVAASRAQSVLVVNPDVSALLLQLHEPLLSLLPPEVPEGLAASSSGRAVSSGSGDSINMPRSWPTAAARQPVRGGCSSSSTEEGRDQQQQEQQVRTPQPSLPRVGPGQLMAATAAAMGAGAAVRMEQEDGDIEAAEMALLAVGAYERGARESGVAAGVGGPPLQPQTGPPLTTPPSTLRPQQQPEQQWQKHGPSPGVGPLPAPAAAAAAAHTEEEDDDMEAVEWAATVDVREYLPTSAAVAAAGSSPLLYNTWQLPTTSVPTPMPQQPYRPQQQYPTLPQQQQPQQMSCPLCSCYFPCAQSPSSWRVQCHGQPVCDACERSSVYGQLLGAAAAGAAAGRSGAQPHLQQNPQPRQPVQQPAPHPVAQAGAPQRPQYPAAWGSEHQQPQPSLTPAFRGRPAVNAAPHSTNAAVPWLSTAVTGAVPAPHPQHPHRCQSHPQTHTAPTSAEWQARRLRQQQHGPHPAPQPTQHPAAPADSRQPHPAWGCSAQQQEQQQPARTASLPPPAACGGHPACTVFVLPHGSHAGTGTGQLPHQHHPHRRLSYTDPHPAPTWQPYRCAQPSTAAYPGGDTRTSGSSSTFGGSGTGGSGAGVRGGGNAGGSGGGVSGGGSGCWVDGGGGGAGGVLRGHRPHTTAPWAGHPYGAASVAGRYGAGPGPQQPVGMDWQ